MGRAASWNVVSPASWQCCRVTDIVAALVAVAIAAVVVAGHCGLNFKIEFVNKFMCGILDGSQSRAVERSLQQSPLAYAGVLWPPACGRPEINQFRLLARLFLRVKSCQRVRQNGALHSLDFLFHLSPDHLLVSSFSLSLLRSPSLSLSNEM